MYRMKLNFKLDLGIKEINNFLEICGGNPVFVENAATVSLEQEVSFIPTEEIIKKYEEIIKSNYSKGEKIECVDCRFAGYEYLYEV